MEIAKLQAVPHFVDGSHLWDHLCWSIEVVPDPSVLHEAVVP